MVDDAVELVEIELVEEVDRKTGKIVTEVNCNNELVMKRLQRELDFHDRYAGDAVDNNKIIIYDTLGGDLRIYKAKKIIMSAVENIKSLKREKITIYI